MKFIVALSAISAVLAAHPDPAAAQSSKEDYIAIIKSAAPADLIDDATIVRMEGSSMQTVQEGSNGWTCMTDQIGVPMCADANALEWAHAWQAHETPPEKNWVHLHAVWRQRSEQQRPVGQG